MTEYPGPNLHDPRETRVRFAFTDRNPARGHGTYSPV